MNGDNLAVRVRELLRDVTSVTHQGEFWSDKEIKRALNSAQDIFVNACLRGELYYLLSGLSTTLFYPAVIPPVSRWRPLPNDYLHYLSAMTNDAELSYTARVYLGASVHVYENAWHNAVFILRNLISGIALSNVNTAFTLFYLRKPQPIGLTALNDNVQPWFNVIDFTDHVYNDIIAVHASILLGMKETQTQREFKNFKEIFSLYSLYPKNLLNLLKDVEQIKEFIKSLQGGGK